MKLKDFKATLHNDISIDDEELYKRHTDLINRQRYGDAAALLANNTQVSGATASLLNSWENKILTLENLYGESAFYDPYLYSQAEPSDEDINGKVIWQQIY